MRSWWESKEQVERVLIVVAVAQLAFFWLVLPILIGTCVDHAINYGQGVLSNFKPVYSLLQLLLLFGPLLISIFLLTKKRWKLALLGVCLCIVGLCSALMNAGRAMQANKSTCVGFKNVTFELQK